MDQPLYNPNEIDQNLNNNFAGNQYPDLNQIQDNQLYMMPPNMNPPPPEQQNPNLDMYEKPYYSNQNPTQTPVNSQQNQPIPSPSPVYYSPPQIDQNPYPQSQPLSQGVPLVQQINYPTQNNGIIVQTQGIPQINYQNYQNIAQVKHQGISQKDQNTFKISSGHQGQCLPSCFIIFGIIELIYGLLAITKSVSIHLFIGIIFFISGIILCNNKKIYFIMGPNNLTVINKAGCSKNVNVYNPGQLLRVDFIYDLGSNIVANRSNMHNYILNIVLSNRQVINVFTTSSIILLEK